MSLFRGIWADLKAFWAWLLADDIDVEDDLWRYH